MCQHEVQWIGFVRYYSDGCDGVINSDILELRVTCRSDVNDGDWWRQHAGRSDVMDFGSDLHNFIIEECSIVIADVLVFGCTLFW